MDRPYILHMFTPGPQASPFDVNMAADAGYQILMPYCNVDPYGVTTLTQDAIFSRGPKGVVRTAIFIGGRDVLLAADMLEAARLAMVPPFAVSLFADPSGSYTTAAGLVAYTEAALQRHHGTDLRGKRVVLLGGVGTVGRIAGVLCAQRGRPLCCPATAGWPRRRPPGSASAWRWKPFPARRPTRCARRWPTPMWSWVWRRPVCR
jgi:methylene-tetrahydromethanopterin dehydrogenase